MLSCLQCLQYFLLFKIIHSDFSVFMTSNYYRREFISDDSVNWWSALTKFNWVFNLSISEIPESNMWWLVTNNKLVGISWQPTATSSNFSGPLQAEWESLGRLVVAVHFCWFFVCSFDDIFTIPYLDLVIRFNRQQLIQEWMILKLPNRFFDIVFPDSDAVVVSTSLRIFFFVFQIWNIPNSNRSFDSTWE